ncbi:MAG TPA: helix-turn-helix domain-containing protein [Candidatus Acidoferrum sp.]|nr:helix-turn-helix domain-containing protein [Candidatus Acidoferrum sp.]
MRVITRRGDESAIFKQRLLTLPEAARYLGCTLWSVRDLIWKGQLPHTRFGKRFQVDVQDLDAMIDREKRREGRDHVVVAESRSAEGFVVVSSAIGDPNDGRKHREKEGRAKSRPPRRRLHLQTEVPDS